MNPKIRYALTFLIIILVLFTCSYIGTDHTKYYYGDDNNVVHTETKVDLPRTMHEIIDEVAGDMLDGDILVTYGRSTTGPIFESVDSINGINLVSISNDTLFILPEDFTTMKGPKKDFKSTLIDLLSNY